MSRAAGHILIVDDEEAICWGLRKLLETEKFTVDVASSAEDALERVGKRPPDLIVLDVRLPGMDGLTAMSKFHEKLGAVPIVVMTAYGNLNTAISATKDGAIEYLTKPFDLEQVVAAVRRGLASRKLSRPAAPPPPSIDEEMIGASPAMQEVFKKIALVAGTEVPTLITGESGTGKELVARAIHRYSPRGHLPFVPIHLAALSPSLVESELFGHVKGAFTGADTDRKGLLELAHGATVFFDEAGDIPLPIQVKLLRVLEQQELTPVGQSRPRPCDFRVIVATNRPLHQMAIDGTFRQDLYYRLAGFEIGLPPLRTRQGDIPLLAEHFLRHSRIPRREGTWFSKETMEELCRRPWPGNVRELRSAIEHGALMARGGVILPDHLPPTQRLEDPVSGSSLQNAVRAWATAQLAANPSITNLHELCLDEVEPPLFHTVLDRVAQNRTAASEILGIHRETLRKRIK